MRKSHSLDFAAEADATDGLAPTTPTLNDLAMAQSEFAQSEFVSDW